MFDSALAKKMSQNFFVGRRFLAFTLDLALQLVEGEKLVDPRGPAAAIHLQVGQNNCAFPILLEKNERVAGPKLCRVKHVGIDVAWSDD